MKFSFLKKNKEKINISVPEGPALSVSKAKDEEIYYERADYQDNVYDLDDCFDTKSKVERILESLEVFEKKYLQALHKYHFLKLFNRAALKNKNYNELTLQLDKQINRFKKSYDELKKKTDVLKYLQDVADAELEQLLLKINALFDFCRDINKNLTSYQQTYFPRLKIASYSICNDMAYSEIENLTKAVNQMIDEFKTIREAYDFIVYNSGELIINTVNAFVTGLENSNNPQYKEYDLKYFLASDFVMVLNFSEWVDLFTKFLYIKRLAKDVELFDYLNFKNHYQELEKRYVIMLIYNEMTRK